MNKTKRTRNVHAGYWVPEVEAPTAWSDGEPHRFVLTFETADEKIRVHLSLSQIGALARGVWVAWRTYRESLTARLSGIEDRLRGEDR